MARIFPYDGVMAGEAFALQFAAPTGATAAEIGFSGGGTATFAAEAGAFKTSITSTMTLAMPTITRYAVFVTDASGKKCVESGEFSVTRLNSSYREVLTAVEEAIASWGSNPNQTIAVGEINISYKTLADLLSLRSYYRGLVEEEETGGSSASGGPFIIGTRFTR